MSPNIPANGLPRAGTQHYDRRPVCEETSPRLQHPDSRADAIWRWKEI